MSSQARRLLAVSIATAAVLASIAAHGLPAFTLNPQPLPPGMALNPQPLPPRLAINPQPLPPAEALNPQPLPPGGEA